MISFDRVHAGLAKHSYRRNFRVSNPFVYKVVQVSYTLSERNSKFRGKKDLNVKSIFYVDQVKDEKVKR